MSERTYKYDVAFSFLQEDEEWAEKINDRLRGRVATFIYTEQQLELAGTDGEETFGNVFGEEARIVAILHRPAWGSTKWTRIEETAIRNRGYEEGYEFALLVPIGVPVTPPIWFPKNRIWIGLERRGVEHAAEVIEARIQDAGGVVGIETAEDLAARLNRQAALDEKRRAFLESEAGVKCAEAEVQTLFTEIEQICNRISAKGGKATFRIERQRERFKVSSYNHWLHMRWENGILNSLRRSALTVELMKQDMFDDEPEQLAKEIFRFDGSSSDDIGWRDSSEGSRRLAKKDMADYCVRMLLEPSKTRSHE